MASSREYVDFIMECIGEGASSRAMMGEYVVYYNGKVVGGVYDDRFLIKPTASAVAMLPDAAYELPYAGAKEMLLADRLEDGEFMHALMEAMYAELPFPEKRK